MANPTDMNLLQDATHPDAMGTRERILNAAEDAFAQQGYFAATIRGITQAAGVEWSLSRYYFGSKDELFRQVVARRAHAICDMLDASLALACPNGTPLSVTAVVEAMVEPALNKLSSGDTGWRNYLRLLSSFGLLHERPDLLSPWKDRYAPTAQRYFEALSAALPHAPLHTIGWGLHFLQSLLGHALLDVGVTRRIAGSIDTPVSWPELHQQLVLHVVGGLLAQASDAPGRGVAQLA